ncbi:MAG: group III truncated hemoglobin [Chitinophagales bacterium]
MKDIRSRNDIELLVNDFYKKALKDEKIGFIFTDIVQLNWKTHIPIICDFWESVLLDNIKYKGNPILKHIALNKKINLKKEHFERWLMLWQKSVQRNFAGKIADEAIKKANMMGNLMRYKIEKSNDAGFIQ